MTAADLCRQHEPHLRQLVGALMRTFPPGTEAGDVLQEARLAVLKAAATWDASRGAWEPYANRAISMALQSKARDARRHASHYADVPVSETIAAPGLPEPHPRLDVFPACQRRALLMEQGGYTIADMARFEGRSMARQQATMRAAKRRKRAVSAPPRGELVLPAKCNRTVSLKLPCGLRETIRQAATSAGVTDSEWIRRAIAARLDAA